MTTHNAINTPFPINVASGGTGVQTFTSHGFLYGNAAGNVQVTSELSNGQLLIGNTGNPASLATLTAGTGISITNGSGTITINASGVALAWVDQSGTTVTMAINTGYICDSSSLITLSLPTTAAIGSVLEIVYKGTGGWTIAQALGQQIVYGNVSTTSGTGGSLASSAAGDAVRLVCTTANTTFTVLSSQGNLTYV